MNWEIISLFLSYYIVITVLFAHMEYWQELTFVQTSEQNKQQLAHLKFPNPIFMILEMGQSSK